jgi:hypothetical protein
MNKLVKRTCQVTLAAAFVASPLASAEPAASAPAKAPSATPVFAPNCAAPLHCASVCLRSGRCKTGSSVQPGCLLYACRGGAH